MFPTLRSFLFTVVLSTSSRGLGVLSIWRGVVLLLPLVVACQRAAALTASVAQAGLPVIGEVSVFSISPRMELLLAQPARERKTGQRNQLNISAINTTLVQKAGMIDSTHPTALVQDFHSSSLLSSEAGPGIERICCSSAAKPVTLRQSWPDSSDLRKRSSMSAQVQEQSWQHLFFLLELQSIPACNPSQLVNSPSWLSPYLTRVF